MAKVKYIDHEGAADEVQLFGVTFKAGKETEVSNDVAIRLMGNRYFQSVAPKSEPAAKTNEPDILEAVHRGRGVYAIVKGADVLKEGLSKEDAEAFNALSEDEKLEKLTEPAAPAAEPEKAAEDANSAAAAGDQQSA